MVLLLAWRLLAPGASSGVQINGRPISRSEFRESMKEARMLFRSSKSGELEIDFDYEPKTELMRAVKTRLSRITKIETDFTKQMEAILPEGILTPGALVTNRGRSEAREALAKARAATDSYFSTTETEMRKYSDFVQSLLERPRVLTVSYASYLAAMNEAHKLGLEYWDKQLIFFGLLDNARFTVTDGKYSFYAQGDLDRFRQLGSDVDRAKTALDAALNNAESVRKDLVKGAAQTFDEMQKEMDKNW